LRLAFLALMLLAPAARAAPPPETALIEGNRRFRDGDLEGAMRAYAAGYDSRADPVLAYNLGVTAHHLGRLPEAVLWYRRAEAAMGPLGPLENDDLWLRDNLELARSSLGAPERESPIWARWVARRRTLLLLGIVLAWSLPLLATRPERWLVALVAVLAFLAFTAGVFVGRLGPRAAVLLADCPAASPGHPLPAGTEVWVSREGEEWRVAGETGGPVCPPETVALIEP
jgi:hypothetical protein